jgi:hypothetical protein
MEKITHAMLDQREGRIIKKMLACRAMAPTAYAVVRREASAEFVEIDRYRLSLLDKAKA